MTFGEHLDELRVVLFRAVIGLVVGFLLGLLLAKPVVHWINLPAEKALNEHYEKVAEERLDTLYPDGLPDDLQEFMKEERLVFDEVYIEQIRDAASGGRRAGRFRGSVDGGRGPRGSAAVASRAATWSRRGSGASPTPRCRRWARRNRS